MTNVVIIFEAIKITAAIVAGGFAYFKFFREGTHHQRIQFDLDCVDMGELAGQRVIEIGCVAENKGNIEQRFDDIVSQFGELSRPRLRNWRDMSHDWSFL